MTDNKKAVLGLAALVAVCGLLDCASAQASGYEPYLKVGLGYKFSEQDGIRFGNDPHEYRLENEPISARGEVGFQNGCVSFGISHHSQWAAGWPFNDKWEYHKTELFIDFTFGG